LDQVCVNARFLTQAKSGVQNYALNLCLALKKKYPGITFLTCKGVLHQKEAERLDAIVTGTFAGHLWEQIDLPLWLRKNGSPLLINFCNTAPINYHNQFNTIHDLAFEQTAKWFSKRFTYFYRWLMPQVAVNCKKLFTVSDFSAAEIAERYAIRKDRIVIMPNSISDEMLHLISEMEGTVADEKYFLTVGSLDPRKNTTGVYDAFISLKLPDIKLKIVGRTNPVFRKVSGIPDQNPMVEWIDSADNKQLVNLYSHAVAAVSLSLYEGFGLPNLEAMACGCPVIASGIPAFREVCADAAWFADPGNVKEAAILMLKALEDKASVKSLVEKGLKRSALFTVEKSLQVLEAELQREGINLMQMQNKV
jgi:glycosyltransferase involved in cell wall biosynthesis